MLFSNFSYGNKSNIDELNYAESLYLKGITSKENLRSTTEQNTFFREAGYSYSTLANENPSFQANLYFNAANAFYMADDLGEAIWNYKKAVRSDILNKAIKHNLEIALDRQSDALPKNGFLNIFTIKAILLFNRFIFEVLFFISFSLIWISLSIKLYRPKKKWLRLLLPVSTGCSLTFGLLWMLSIMLMYNTGEGVIIQKECIARKGSSTIYEPFYQESLHEGLELKIIREERNYSLCNLPNGDNVWLLTEAIRKL